MKITFQNILVLYKKSIYEIYFLDKNSSLYRKEKSVSVSQLRLFKQAHDRHYQTLSSIEKILKFKKMNFRSVQRGKHADYRSFDLIISVGGDGTFLEAARNLNCQPLLGVNSDPKKSVGQLCAAKSNNLRDIIDRLLNGQLKIKKLNRLKIMKTGLNRSIHVLNDILICHANPAALSRYRLVINPFSEEQKSSGIWVSTAAGSTGAIHSAGGKILSVFSRHFQYRPRELYRGYNSRYQLKGKILKPDEKIKVISLMRNGVVFLDGAHLKIPFRFGETVLIQKSPFSLNTYQVP